MLAKLSICLHILSLRSVGSDTTYAGSTMLRTFYVACRAKSTVDAIQMFSASCASGNRARSGPSDTERQAPLCELERERGSGVARNAGPSRKPGFQQDEVVPRTELIGYLEKPNQRLLTGQDPWLVNGHTVTAL
jgi:hypothetical protein